jgi:hypothetical protein
MTMKRAFLHLAIGLLAAAAGRANAQSNVVATNVMAVNISPTNAALATAGTTNANTTSTNAASTNDAPVRMDSRYFQFIAQRNIFDQTRRRPIIRDNNPQTPPARIDSFTLTGVGLDNNQGAAMFDSSSSLYRKVMKTGETIAGYRIAEITPNLDSIKLAASSNQVVEMKVGMQMRRRNNGPWLLASSSGTVTPPPTTESGDSAPSSDTNSTGATPGTSVSNADDIIKRLMEKRAKE